MPYKFRIKSIRKYEDFRKNIRSLEDNTLEDNKFAPMPPCLINPAGFYTEYDCLIGKAGSEPERGFVTNFTCSNGVDTFEYMCDFEGTEVTLPSCYLKNGATGYFGNGLLLYAGSETKEYKITVNIMHTYLSSKVDSTILAEYNQLVNYDCSNPDVYTYTPGLSIYIGENEVAHLKPKEAYGGSNDKIHDTINISVDCSCAAMDCPYPPISLTHDATLAKKGGDKNTQIHCKIVNPNNKTIRCVGSINIVPKY